MQRLGRLLFYALLAAICYGLAMTVGGRVAVIVFFVAGGLGELAFWKELLFPKPRTGPSES